MRNKSGMFLETKLFVFIPNVQIRFRKLYNLLTNLSQSAENPDIDLAICVALKVGQ